ncbi:DUF1800 domain-containing protein [Histidinibacterium lentulum]|uniref:DUF1800 domain-containing protein n=1 Tax=Histidinibacterium lentulum TaxID=2480588 RepID=A0A3N2R532_9RHOB|nr:DUF1800 domain-containing protein [Histidinibacterium lentulum]ROU02503.1 DUF1800 domain-containing protein [Histidinibacterium lentulum]
MYDPYLAEIRFGTGLSPRRQPPARLDDMLEKLAGPDVMAEAFPIPRTERMRPAEAELHAAVQAVRRAPAAGLEAARRAREALFEEARRQRDRALVHTLLRGARTRDGMRERLVAFWANHFTVVPRYGSTRHLVASYVEDVIRPHVTGRFGDMLRAVVRHPMMLHYLDQHRSIGPNSQYGRDTGRGLNENLARELLELHTVGAGGPYGQKDVRELAELLSGLFSNTRRGFHYRVMTAEPGAEEVLGRSYGTPGGPERLEHVEAFLADVAVHPATARHLAGKLVRHFLSDVPDPAVVDRVAGTWRATGGDLLACYDALLSHPAAWAPERRKVRLPVEYLQAALRALDPPDREVRNHERRIVQVRYRRPLLRMGQEWENPLSPAGFPDRVSDWVTPQGLAARIDWAMEIPSQLADPLPDPRRLAEVALGPFATEEVLFAARAAETRAEGVGLILASAAFQRR